MDAIPRFVAAELAPGETVRWTGRPFPPIGEPGHALFGALVLIGPPSC